ncbi:amino ABC transporter permease protein, 3-TM region, His/Glu/Gln/Arg/opine family domain-containing protein 5 [Pseudomonas sp. CFII64]|uniref:ABC transporter permease n=1 Tax=Pseudomonas sp. CFII64 TaxID=911242 RepID=UPI0003580542|nr:ABC transporter permease subunit [Pseudomonas sp. CFII64]EPJ86711.1 amino ABC transporter permease protein, 3-TM region, His/Glu/Gln/Arg/opine family domain-containing protein 5 [Pseudomonas sp. CFII64]
MLGLLSWGDTGYGDELFFGALVTIKVAVLGYLLALSIGTAIALLTLNPHGWRWRFWRVYASLFMGVPALLVAFLLYYGGSEMIASLFGLIGLQVRADVTPTAAGVAALGLVYSAYLAELIRSTIRSLPQGQFEASAMLLIPRRKMWAHIVFPQSIRLALPGLSNMWIVVLKDTALISLVGIKEVIAQAKMAAGNTKEPFLFYCAVSVFFLAFSLLTVWLIGRLDKRKHSQKPKQLADQTT